MPVKKEVNENHIKEYRMNLWPTLFHTNAIVMTFSTQYIALNDITKGNTVSESNESNLAIPAYPPGNRFPDFTKVFIPNEYTNEDTKIPHKYRMSRLLKQIIFFLFISLLIPCIKKGMTIIACLT
jgi:hypothetical protein